MPVYPHLAGPQQTVLLTYPPTPTRLIVERFCVCPLLAIYKYNPVFQSRNQGQERGRPAGSGFIITKRPTMAAMQTQTWQNGERIEAQRMISRAEIYMLLVLKRWNAKTREGNRVPWCNAEGGGGGIAGRFI